jgi:hypothetical protein
VTITGDRKGLTAGRLDERICENPVKMVAGLKYPLFALTATATAGSDSRRWIGVRLPDAH